MTRSRIDVHHHILPTDYVEAVGPVIGSQGSSGRVPTWSLEGSLELMDASGIQAAVTSVSSPGVSTLPDAEAVVVARRANDFSASTVRDYPDRFGFFAAVPMHDVDAALAEVEYSVDTLGADGVCLLTNYNRRYLGDPYFHPLYEELERRGTVVFVHPTTPADHVDVSGLAPSILEFPFDTTRTIASLLVEGVIAKTPSVNWIFSHAGGALPYLSSRLEILIRNVPRLRDALKGDFYELIRSMYFDTAISADPVHFAALRELVPDSQILFGTDYPFGPPGQMADTVERLDRLGLDDKTMSAINSDNATPLFPALAARIAQASS